MSDQLKTWQGTFGEAYISRNDVSEGAVAGKAVAFSRMLQGLTRPPTTILEVGANIGLNLRGLQRITDAKLYALEPNEIARKRLLDDGVLSADRILDGSASAISLPDGSVDLAFTSTVLIHVPPDGLLSACREIHRVARRYILCNEYFAAQPESLEYRGRADLLFKRDFGAFWMDNFASLRLVDYGFLWRRAAAMDSTTWWLFEKPPDAD